MIHQIPKQHVSVIVRGGGLLRRRKIIRITQEHGGTRTLSYFLSPKNKTKQFDDLHADLVDRWNPSVFKKVSIVAISSSIASFAIFTPFSLIPWAITFPTLMFVKIGYNDLNQTSHSLNRNFPFIAHIRYILEGVGPEIRQYFIEKDTDASPYTREQRSIVYQRAKLTIDSQPFGTKRDLYHEGSAWVNHSIYPVKATGDRVIIGNKDCKRPYSASILNISGMSYGALSDPAILALNTAARKGNFYHNTGEGGISDAHREPGGDIVWNIGTGYFGCRSFSDGKFDPNVFLHTLDQVPQVKMIEIKLSQGAKPGHGGLLPGAKVTAKIAKARGVPVGLDCHSPPRHSAFSGPEGLIEFVAKLRELSNGKPVGFKLCVGSIDEFTAIAKAMKSLNIYPDFITIDGAEGGTGAAPQEFSNHVGTPLLDGLYIVNNILRGSNSREHVKLIVSGKVLSGFSIVRNLALGADVNNAARAMMFALGCIQSLKCHTNMCPTGVATQDPIRTQGLIVPDKAERVYNFHRKTVESALDLMGAMGCKGPTELSPEMIVIRTSTSLPAKTFDELYPPLPIGSLLDGSASLIAPKLQKSWNKY